MGFTSATSGQKGSMKLRVLLAVCLLPLFAASLLAQSQQPIFPTTLGIYNSLPVLSGVVGDFNGDGYPDFAYYRLSAPQGPIDLVTLLNQGGHNDPVVVSTSFSCNGATSFSMAAADINKDGKLDLVQTCNGYVVVVLGNGDGSFQIPSNTAYYSVSGATLSAVVPPVDLNGDGYPDVVANANATVGGASSVAVFLNQGSPSPGAFLNPQTYAFPNSQNGVISGMGDFNGDGKQDVIISPSSGPLAIYFGKGDGTLQSAQAQTQSCPNSTGYYTAIGDFNNDGDADIACSSGVSLQTFLGSSGGSLATGPTTSLVPFGSSDIVVIGKNGDNNLDLADRGSTILLGDGQGGFTVGQSYGVTGTTYPLPPDSNGKVDLLIYPGGGSLTRLVSNGDGTFQAPPHIFTGSGFVTADVNNDGLTDTLWIANDGFGTLSSDDLGNLKTGLGRGNGTFTISNSIAAPLNGIVIPGDINGDGKVDVVALLPGNEARAGSPAVATQLFSYLGNGDGTFQPKASRVNLPAYGATNAVLGDFNGDGKLDVVFGYFGPVSITSGLVFVPGNGDGTFGTPVPFSQTNSPTPGESLFAADLSNDGKLDLIWNGSVYLGNGDGTFRQIPLGIASPAQPQALGDLNGDGKLDIVAGSNVYAGNGDGSFQTTTPFFTYSGGNVPVFIGDVNGDGNPDLLTGLPVAYPNNALGNYQLTVFLGTGNGNFVQDSNAYIYPTNFPQAGGAIARLNSQAPAPPNDKTLDFIAPMNFGATSLLNQLNPAPGAAQPVPSRTTLAVSATSVVANQDLTFTITVTGIAPTGNVTFRSSTSTFEAPITNGVVSITTSRLAGTYSFTASYPGDTNNNASTSNTVTVTVTPAPTTTALSASSSNINQGQLITYTATVTAKYSPTGTITFTSGTTALGKTNIPPNGVASLPVFANTAGTYSVTASYSGDANNQPSTSNAVSITVVAPDFTLTTDPSSATVKAGQSATFAINMTSAGGYSGTMKLSCGSLPAETTCTFSPATLTGSGTSANSTLTITTTAPTAMLERPGSSSTRIAVWAVLLGLCLSPRRVLRSRKNLARIMTALLLTMGSFGLPGWMRRVLVPFHSKGRRNPNRNPDNIGDRSRLRIRPLAQPQPPAHRSVRQVRPSHTNTEASGHSRGFCRFFRNLEPHSHQCQA